MSSVTDIVGTCTRRGLFPKKMVFDEGGGSKQRGSQVMNWPDLGPCVSLTDRNTYLVQNSGRKESVLKRRLPFSGFTVTRPGSDYNGQRRLIIIRDAFECPLKYF